MFPYRLNAEDFKDKLDILKQVFKYWGVKQFMSPRIKEVIELFLYEVNEIQSVEMDVGKINRLLVPIFKIIESRTDIYAREAYICEKSRNYLDILDWSYLKKVPSTSVKEEPVQDLEEANETKETLQKTILPVKMKDNNPSRTTQFSRGGKRSLKKNRKKKKTRKKRKHKYKN